MTNGRDDNPARTFGIPHSTLVILLTMVAGLLRFYSIDKPSIWGDEAATWRRVSGSYQQLVDELRLAGFMPGHYLVTWWIKDGFPVWGHYTISPPDLRDANDEPWFMRRFAFAGNPALQTRSVWTPTVRLVPGGITPTPLMLRFVPALCGTLMVPAMYFLASRLVARRTALLAALFTCCSAFMLNYSRDAKMYAQFWFFATLHVGCLLWWLDAYRRRSRVVETVRPSSKQFELGAGVADILPNDHIRDIGNAFGPSSATVEIRSSGAIEVRLQTFLRFACWLTAGLVMIAFNGLGLAIVGIELVIVLATIPQRVQWIADLGQSIGRRLRFKRDEQHDAVVREIAVRRSLLSRLCIPPLLSFLAGATCIVLLFTSYRSFTHFYDRIEPARPDSAQIDVEDAGISWIEPYNRGRTPESHFLENATVYLFNWEWVKPSEMQFVDPETLFRLRLAAVILLAALGTGLAPWRAVMERVTGAPRQRGPMPATALLIVGAWLLVPAYAFHAASGAWTETGQRIAAVSPVATVASAIFPSATPGAIEPLRGALANVVKPLLLGDQSLGKTREKLAALPWRQLFVVRNLHDSPPRWWVIGLIACVVLLAMLSWQRPVLVAAPAIVQPAGTFGETDDERFARKWLRHRRIVAWWSTLILTGLAAALALTLLFGLMLMVFVAVPPQVASIWMPRYLGFVWPAFVIVACVLIRRLPLFPIRWLAIAALLAVNLTNFSMRLNYGEPPTAEIAKDHLAVENRATSWLFAPMIGRRPLGGPGSGGMFSIPEAYYAFMLSNTPTTPRDVFEHVDGDSNVRRVGQNYASAIHAQLAPFHNVDDVYVWAQMPLSAGVGEVQKNLSGALGPDWQEAEPVKRWTIFDHWTWQQLHILERHHLKRSDALIVPSSIPKATNPPVTPPNIVIRPSPRPSSRPAVQAATRPAMTTLDPTPTPTTR